MAKNIHTVYNSDRQMWENKREGSGTPLSSHHTKENALELGERFSKNAEVEHFIHGKDGKIQERNSYGNDPFPPRGYPWSSYHTQVRAYHSGISKNLLI